MCNVFVANCDLLWRRVMLTVIKTLLFLCSFIFASCVFFAIYFGHSSCFFANPGLNSKSLPIPWWVSAFLVSILLHCQS